MTWFILFCYIQVGAGFTGGMIIEKNSRQFSFWCGVFWPFCFGVGMVASGAAFKKMQAKQDTLFEYLVKKHK